MSQAILPLPVGITWNVVKRANWSTIIQRGASGREVRSPLYTSPIWEFELAWEWLPDYASPAFDDFDPPASPTLSSVVPALPFPFPTTTYYVVITYVYPEGETLASTEVAITVAATEALRVASPSNPGSGAIGWNCYVGTWSGGEVLQLLGRTDFFGDVVPTLGVIPFGTNWDEIANFALSAHTNDPLHYFGLPGAAQAITPPPQQTPESVLIEDSVYTPWQQLIGFYNARQASFDSFLFADATDSFLFNPIGTGDGVTTQFQISKSYGGFTEPIKDILGPVSVAVAGSYVTSGFTVGPTGIITFGTAPTAGQIIDVSTSFFRRVRFSDDNLEGNNFLYNLFELKSMKLTSVKV